MTRRPPSLPWLATLTLVLAAAACGPATPPTRPAAGAAAAEAGPSIYDLDLALVDDTGRALHLADLRGQALIAAMMYASCTSVCPQVTEDMKTIERQLGTRVARDVTFVLFSLDPGRDTPQALHRFGAEHGLDPSRWRLFAESEDGTRDLAAVLGVKYKRQISGDLAHSAMIFVIDRNGVVRHRQVGLTGDPHDLVEALAQARS